MNTMSDFKRCDRCLSFFPAIKKEVSVLQIRESKSLSAKVFANYDICPKCRDLILEQLAPVSGTKLPRRNTGTATE